LKTRQFSLLLRGGKGKQKNARGKMNLFYATEIAEGLLRLDADEAHHCAQVLRYKPGDELYATDGQGGFFRARLIETSKKQCLAQAEETQREYGRRPFRLHLGIAPTKNISRLEWLLEKATEIGIDEITPLQCEHSERARLRPERLEKILLSATKQSLKAYLPRLNELVPLKQFLAEQRGASGQQFIAHLGEGVKGHLKHNYQPGQDVCILVGPEGGFSTAEILASQEAGFLPVSLGPGRLRTETAGLVACAALNLLNE
jgi:16S rRNA (uracil1498-N3)-methyltransferase